MQTASLLVLQRRPLLSVMLGSLMISFSAVFVKLTAVSADTAAFYRVFFGGLGLALLSLLLGEPRRFSMRPMLLLLAAAASLALDLASWHRSIALVGPGLATILINCQVFLLALWGVAVQRERLPLQIPAAMVMALFGVWLLVDSSGGGGHSAAPPWQGIFWGLLAAVAFAAYILCIRASQTMEDKLAPMSNMAVASLATAVLLGGYCTVTGASLAIPTTVDGFWLLTYGLVSQCAGWLLISQGLPHLSSSVGGLTILVMPTFSFIWDILFFDRPTGLWGALGAILAIVAIRLGVAGRAGKKSGTATRYKHSTCGSSK